MLFDVIFGGKISLLLVSSTKVRCDLLQVTNVTISCASDLFPKNQKSTEFGKSGGQAEAELRALQASHDGGMFPLASKDPQIPAGWRAWIPKDGKPRLWKRRHRWCRLRTGKVQVEEVESKLCKCLMMFDVWSCCGLLLVCLLGFGCSCCLCVVEMSCLMVLSSLVGLFVALCDVFLCCSFCLQLRYQRHPSLPLVKDS